MFSISDVFAMTSTENLIMFWVSAIFLGMGFLSCLVVSISNFSFNLEEDDDILRIIFLLAFLVGLALVIYCPFSAQKEHNMKYQEIMTIDNQIVYTESELLDTYEIHRAKGLYRIDSSKMTKEIYMQCFHDSVNPYDIIVVPSE